MTLDDLKRECRVAEIAGFDSVMLLLPKGTKLPKGFPRGELLCESEQGRVYRFKRAKLEALVKRMTLDDLKRAS